MSLTDQLLSWMADKQYFLFSEALEGTGIKKNSLMPLLGKLASQDLLISEQVQDGKSGVTFRYRNLILLREKEDKCIKIMLDIPVSKHYTKDTEGIKGTECGKKSLLTSTSRLKQWG